MHYQERKKFVQKANEALERGMKEVASYYAAIGNIHAVKMAEAHNRASVKILEHKNAHKDPNRLDLHYLHISEALKAAKLFLTERQQLLVAKKVACVKVTIITGRGNHSHGGQARLKPAIKEFLQSKGFSFHEENSGAFVVTLKNRL